MADREWVSVQPLPVPLEPRTAAAPRVVVIIPVYNEEGLLQGTFDALSKVLDRLEATWSVLFVNDGSSDNTVGVLEALFMRDARVSYIMLSRNFGHQAALTAGLDHADADVVVMMDADLQHPPELLADLLEAWRAGYEVVHTRKLSTAGLPWIRRVATKLAYKVIGRVTEVSIVPNASDYRLLDRSVFEAVRAMPERSRLYRGLTAWVGFRQCVISYAAPARTAGRSRYDLRQLVGLFTRSLFDFSDMPLHFGLALGAIAMSLSALYASFVLVWFVAGESTPPGWVSSISVSLLLNSITLAFCGIIGVYVARIYNEVRNRPSYMLSRIRKHPEAKTVGDSARHSTASRASSLAASRGHAP